MISLAVFFVLCFVVYIIKKNIGLLNICNPIVPLFYYHTVFLLVALLYMEKYVHIDVSLQVVAFILYGYVMLFLSAVTMGHLLGVRKGSILAMRFTELVYVRSSYFWAAIIIQSIMLFFILMFYMQKGVLIFAEDADNYRVEARKGLGYLIVLFRWVSELFVVVGTLSIFSSTKSKKIQILVFCLLYLITFIFMLGLGSRAFVLELVLIVVAIFYWSKNKGIDFRLLVIGGGFFVFLGVMSAFRQGLEVGGDLVLEKALWRPFVNIQNLQWIFDDFNSYGFLYGKSLFIELGTLMPGYQPNFGTWYKEEFGYIFSGGSITMTYLGEAYANFGYIGVLVIPILIGFFIAFVSYAFQRGRSFFWLFISIMASLSLKGFINVGIGATIVGTVLPVLFSIFLFVFIKIILELGKKNKGMINV